MRTTTITCTISCFSFLAAALPTVHPGVSGHGFSLDLTKRDNPSSSDIDGYSRLTKRTQSSTGITDLFPADQKWTVNIVVGGQSLPVVLDTGSQDLWFESNLEPASMTGTNHPLYTPAPSSAPISGLNWAAKFDSSPQPAAQGVAYSETLVIGTATVTNQIVGAATSLAAADYVRKSGIMGLSYSPYQSNYGSASPAAVMKNMYQQLKISQFAVDLRTDNSGHLDFGFIDQSKYQGSITYINRDTHLSNWMINLDNVYYINKVQQTGNISNSNIAGLTHVDTGAPNMNFPAAVVQNYYNSVPGSSKGSDGVYRFPCSQIQNGMPSFGVSIKGVEFDVPGTWMWTSQSGSTCTGALQTSSTSGAAYSILGDTFLSIVYAVFDVFGPTNNGQVGFATKTLPTRALPT